MESRPQAPSTRRYLAGRNTQVSIFSWFWTSSVYTKAEGGPQGHPDLGAWLGSRWEMSQVPQLWNHSESSAHRYWSLLASKTTFLSIPMVTQRVGRFYLEALPVCFPGTRVRGDG